MSSPQFCIGTAKLGDENYGYSSDKSDRDMEKFFNKCKELEIYNFDTSPRYSNSEKILGKYLSKSTEYARTLKIHTEEKLQQMLDDYLLFQYETIL